MSWGRTDDSKVLDPDIGALTDTEYRSLDALLQYCLREHRDSGIFAIDEIPYAIYATPAGPKHVTPKQLSRFRELKLVVGRDYYDDEEIAALDLDWPDPVADHLRIRNWEKFNPPRDLTAAERKKRQRDKERRTRDSHTEVTDESRRDTDDSHAVTPSDVTDASRPLTRAPAPASSVPSRPFLDQQRSLDHSERAASKATDNGTPADLIARLILELRDADKDTPAVIRSFAKRLPPAAFETAREQILEGRATIQSDSAYAVDLLKLYEAEGRYAS